ncbi:MAG: signal peptide peptidase SppA [Nanoarchaeota archaeon]|nr:signal peptide peptidase SppA [Nanoarchaeota archaeon]
MPSSKKIVPQRNTLRSMLWIIVFLTLGSMLVANSFSFLRGEHLNNGNIAVIAVKGVILTEDASSFSMDITSSSEIVSFIDDAASDDSIKGILLEINSPGGSAVAAEEVAFAIEQAGKPTVSWIRDIGTSGAYWIASSTDHIVSSRMSIVGSIGVTASYLQFSGLLSDYNISYQRLVAGKYKDIGSPLRDMTREEKILLQRQLDIVHDFFIDTIAENRNLSRVSVAKMATGMFFVGSDAYSKGLVDTLGGKAEALSYLEGEIGMNGTLHEYAREKTLLDMLSSVMSGQSFSVGAGIGSSLVERSSLGVRI